MLNECLNRLHATIQWAHRDADLDLLRHAQHTCSQAERAVLALPAAQQQAAWLQLDALLPMEWPLWMEACRFEEARMAPAARVLH